MTKQTVLICDICKRQEDQAVLGRRYEFWYPFKVFFFKTDKADIEKENVCPACVKALGHAIRETISEREPAPLQEEGKLV